MRRTGISSIIVIFAISGILFSSSMLSQAYGHNPQEVVDQSFTGTFTFAATGANLFPNTGQSFTPSASNLISVDVFVVDSSGGVQGTDSITVDVFNGNQPGVGLPLRTATVNNINTVGASLANPLLVHLHFSQLTLNPGMYSLQVSSGSANTEFAGHCLLQPPGPYQFGEFWQIVIQPPCDLGFVTYFSQQSGEPPIGGELLPIESTSLLVAGINSVAVWMIPVLMAAIGIGLVFVRKQ